MKGIVFFSWQSDTESNSGREFLQQALELGYALKRLSSARTVLVLDVWAAVSRR
jgi:hypothetical protein